MTAPGHGLLARVRAGQPQSAGACCSAAEGHRDEHGLAGAVAVLLDSPRAAVQLDQVIDQRQAPTAFVVGARTLPHWPASAVVADLDPQVTAGGAGQTNLDLAVAVDHRARHQLTRDELDEIGMLAKSPAGKRLAGLLAGTADWTGSRSSRQLTASSSGVATSIHLLTPAGALREAGTTLGRHLLEDGVMYASSEPCPM